MHIKHNCINIICKIYFSRAENCKTNLFSVCYILNPSLKTISIRHIFKMDVIDVQFCHYKFPHLDSTSIPNVPAHGVYVALILHYARACSLYSDFLQRCHLLSTKLLSPRFSNKCKLQKRMHSTRSRK